MFFTRGQFSSLNLNTLNVLCYRVLFLMLIICGGTFLFYHQAKGIFPADLQAHIDFINLFVKQGMRAPEVGFEYTIYAISKIIPIGFTYTAIAILVVMLLLLTGITYKLLDYFLMLSEGKKILYTFFLMTMSAIYLPFFNKDVYLGQGSPNVWHNPTLFMVKPFAFAVIFLTIYAMDKQKYAYWILCSILLLISMFYKPSFAIVFIPALAIYLLIDRPYNLKIILYAFFLVLPAMIFSLYQYDLLLHFGNTDQAISHGETIIFSKFGVLRLYTPNVFVSLLLGLAFPLSILLFRFKAVLANHYLKLTWIILIIAYLQMAFLAEYDPSDPYRFVSGNFMWGYLIALQPLFIFSFIEFYKWSMSKQMITTVIERLQLRFTMVLFALHIMSGFFYTLKIFCGGGYR